MAIFNNTSNQGFWVYDNDENTEGAGRSGRYALIIPDNMAGRRRRYTVWEINGAHTAKIIGRELPIGLSKKIAKLGLDEYHRQRLKSEE